MAKKIPTKKKLKTFLNDADGLSARDYLLLISTFTFFTFVAIGLLMVLFQQNLGKMYLSLLDMVSPVVMTIVGGVFGVQAVESIAKGRTKKEKNIRIYEETRPYEDDMIEEVEVPEEEQ